VTEPPCPDTGKPCDWTCDEWYDDEGFSMGHNGYYCRDCGREKPEPVTEDAT
jgi:hypothetical protein